jgi:hypothetical protein
MSSVISASTTSTTALTLSGDTSGQLEIKTGSGPTTAVTIDTSQRVAFVAGTALLPSITTTGDLNTGVFFPAADTIAFTEGGVESMRIDSSGRLLLGNSTSNNLPYIGDQFAPGFQNYAVSGTGGFYRYSANSDPCVLTFAKSRNATIGSQTVVSSGDNLGYIGFAGSDGTNFITAASIIGMVDGTPGTNDMPGRLVFTTTADGASSPTERMRINSSGNVGIGTSTITSGAGWTPRLVLSGTSAAAVIKGANSQEVSVGSSDGMYIDCLGNTTGSNNNIIFRNTASNSTFSATERMRIDTSGNVLVGRSDNPSGVTGCLYATNNYNLTTASAANVFINSEGLFFRSTSSLKYKQDIQDATHGLAEVLQLRPVTYKGKSELDGDTIFGGLIAEEVHEAGLTEFVQYAEDGSPDALAYGNMVSLAFKAIQELNAKVDAQAVRIAELEGAK